MSRVIFSMSLIATLFASGYGLWAGEACSPLPKPASPPFACDATTLHPTQSAVGFGEVEARKAELEKKSALKLEEYLYKHSVRLVRGLKGILYIVDHHHLARILTDMNTSEKLYCDIVADYSSDSEDNFWKRLTDECWAYLFDSSGKPINYNQLPGSVSELDDDPYRTLAWLVKENHGYCKVDVPFAEFKWAAFFREAGIQPNELDRAITAAKTCGTHPKGSLPGCKVTNSVCNANEDDDD